MKSYNKIVKLAKENTSKVHHHTKKKVKLAKENTFKEPSIAIKPLS